MSNRAGFDGDKAVMRRALALARRGSGLTAPNPMVGAVVTKGDKIVGYGWHQRAGEAHAEVEALKMAGTRALGSTLHVTLEPCNHHGKTPPCSEAIIKAGISRVVVAMKDPNPHVSGGGLERLKEAGVELDIGVLEKEALELNCSWLTWVTKGRPYVVLKLALSLDSKLAYSDGSSKWISSEVSRSQVHRLRRLMDAVIVGVGTVLSDDPMLSNRTGFGRQPLRVIVDSHLRVPLSARVFGNDGDKGVSRVLVASTSLAEDEKRRALEKAGVEVVVLDGPDGRVDLLALISLLGERGVQGVLCEGGAELATALVQKELCDRLLLYRAPLVIGSRGLSWYAAEESAFSEKGRSLKLQFIRRVGPDVLSVYNFI